MAKDGNHKVGRYKIGILVNKHHTVGIAVVNHTNVGLVLAHVLLQHHAVFGHKRISLVIWESTVKFVTDIHSIVAQQLLDKQRRHSIATVNAYLQV